MDHGEMRGDPQEHHKLGARGAKEADAFPKTQQLLGPYLGRDTVACTVTVAELELVAEVGQVDGFLSGLGSGDDFSLARGECDALLFLGAPGHSGLIEDEDVMTVSNYPTCRGDLSCHLWWYV